MVCLGTERPILPKGIETMKSLPGAVRPLGTLLAHDNKIYRIVKHKVIAGISREVIDPVGRFIGDKVEWFPIS